MIWGHVMFQVFLYFFKACCSMYCILQTTTNKKQTHSRNCIQLLHFIQDIFNTNGNNPCEFTINKFANQTIPNEHLMCNSEAKLNIIANKNGYIILTNF